jgi:hypothetical protein
MTTFDEREKEFEARFKHDQEFRFKVTARRNRLLGLWAAEQLGLGGEATQSYAKAVVEAEFAPGGDRHVVDKIAADFAAKGISLSAAQIRFELDRFAEQAKKQLMAE